MAYPASLDTFNGTTAQGTSTQSSPDHALDHRTLGSAVGTIERVVGTTAGTAVLMNFAAGDFAARINSSNVPQQALNSGTLGTATLGSATLTGGTLAGQIKNNGTITAGFYGTATLGSATLTGGTANNQVMGTPTITGPTINTGTANTSAFNGGTIGTAIITGGITLPVNGSITQTSTADHITLTPGSGKYVRQTIVDQAGTTNTARPNVVIKTGWTFVNGDGSGADFNKAVTFDAAFGTVLGVTLGKLGIIDGSDPTLITQFGVPVNGNVGAGGISTAGFTAYLSLSSTSTLNRRYGMDWIAYGLV